MDVFDLFAKISLDTSGYDNNLKSASNNFSKFGKAVTTGVKTAMKVGAAAIAGIGTASVATGKKVVDLAGKTAEYGDNIDKMSQKMGISAKAYQEWDAIMQHSGSSIDAMKGAFKTLAKQTTENADEFKKLGITQEQLKSMSQEDIFNLTITKLQDMGESAERTAIATKLLGRGGVELGALLNTSSKDTEEMRKRVNELGGVMSDKAVKAAAKYQDTLQDMQTALSATTRELGSKFMPAVTKIMDGLTNIFAGEKGGKKKISKGINQLLKAISSAIPKLAEVGAGIIQGIGESIFKNMDKVVNFGAKVIDFIVEGIANAIPKIADGMVAIMDKINESVSGSGSKLAEIANTIITNLVNALNVVLPNLLTTGVNIITELASGIAQALPELIPQAVSVVIELVNTIIQQLPQVVEAGIQLINGLVEGISSAIPMVLDAAPKLIGDLAQKIVECIPMIMDAGTNLLSKLADDLPTIIDNIVEKIPEIIDNIVSAFTDDGNKSKMGESGQNLFTALIKKLPKIILTITMAVPKIVLAVVKAIVKALPQIWKAGFEFFGGLVKRIPEALEYVGGKVVDFMNGVFDKIKEFDLIEFGKNLIEGLWQGISSMAGWIGDKVTGFFDGIVGGIADVLGIASPSKVMRDRIGKNMALGVGVGFDKEYASVKRDMMRTVGVDDWSVSTATASRASGNYELLGLMRKISSQLDMINTDMVQTIENTDTTIVLNDREFGRAVRRYA